MRLIIGILFLLSVFSLEIILMPGYLPKNFKATPWSLVLSVLSITLVFTYKLLPDDNSDENIAIDEKTMSSMTKWIIYLDEIVSLYCVGGAISAIASNNPSRYAVIYLVTILLYSIHKMHQNDPDFFWLQFKINKNDDEKQQLKYKLKAISREYKFRKHGRPLLFYYVGTVMLMLIYQLDPYILEIKKLIEK